MEKDYRDQMADRAAKLIEDFDRLREEWRDLLKVCRENPEEYAEILRNLERICGEWEK
jgi:hypothetical protein